jgi:hypothetical protein
MTTEKYLKREEIQDVHETLKDLLTELRERTQAETDMFEVHQVCMQLLPEADGKQWKMFVYFEPKDCTYYFSYQDEELDDTMFTRGYELNAVMAQMVAEIIRVKDFEWIELV